REPFPNKCFVLVKSLERCDDPQGHTPRDEAPAPAPGTKNERPSCERPARTRGERLPLQGGSLSPTFTSYWKNPWRDVANI
ncbi:Hypothetical predicted protein, partial [Podarcis lilfordi]